MTKIPRYDARRDSNEKEIVDALKAVGASVERLDVIDLLCGYRGINYLLEVKTPDGALNEKQSDWIRAWNGGIYIVRTVDEALRAIGAIE